MLPADSLLERQVRDHLGIEARVCVAQEAVGPTELTGGECLRYRGLGGARRADWLRGRMALKTLLRRLGENEDTSGIRFPSARFSLTHSRDIAVAIESGSARSPGCGGYPLAGIGVDLELDRLIRKPAARFFLTESEWRAIDGLSAAEQRSALLRLWTVKEALFKADPDNARAWFTHYVVDKPGARTGRATLHGRDGQRRHGGGLDDTEMRYTSSPLASGWVTFAVSRPVAAR